MLEISRRFLARNDRRLDLSVQIYHAHSPRRGRVIPLEQAVLWNKLPYRNSSELPPDSTSPINDERERLYHRPTSVNLTLQMHQEFPAHEFLFLGA